MFENTLLITTTIALTNRGKRTYTCEITHIILEHHLFFVIVFARRVSIQKLQTKPISLHNEHDNKNGGNVCHINSLHILHDFVTEKLDENVVWQ